MAALIIFPMVHRIGSIRRLARAVEGYDHDAAERILRKPLEQMHAALLRRGLPAAEAEQEMRDFRAALAVEIYQQQRVYCCDDDDGAA